MSSIDQRVVQMVFDNKKFESGVKTTIETLSNLKKSLKLDDAASSFSKLENSAKKVSLSSLSESVDSVANRFSSLGIVGMTVLQNITTSAMNAGKSLLNALTAPLIEGGKRRALNIEQAKFQIEGLGYTWDSVKDDINYGVKDTAYGLDAAAKVASQLIASNVQVGDSMKQALRGVSGVAAMTSSEYEDIGKIFTTVAGNGRLMGDQLQQLSARGLNAAATLGNYLGKSEAQVREMTSKGQIDFATFAAAMDSAFGEHAKEANKTFTGSLSNMKAALSRIGADFFTPGYQNLRDVFNALTPVIDSVHTALKPLLASAEEGMGILSRFAAKVLGSLDVEKSLSGPLKSLDTILRAVGGTLTNLAKIVFSVVGPIASAFASTFGGTLLDVITRFFTALEKITAQFILTERMSDNLSKTFEGIFTILSVLVSAISKVVGVIAVSLFNVAARVFNFILDIILAITGYIGELVVKIKSFVDSILQLDTVKSIFSAIRNVITRLTQALDKVYNAVRKLANAIIDGAFQSAHYIFSNILDIVLSLAIAIDKAIMKVADLISKFKELPIVQNIISNLRNIVNKLNTDTSKVASTVRDKLIGAFSKAKEVIDNFVTKVKELIEKYVQLPSLQEGVARLQELISNIFQKSVEIFNKVKEVIGKIIDKVRELTTMSFNQIVENLGKVRDKILSITKELDAFGKIKFVFETVKNAILDAAKTTDGAIGTIKAALSSFISWLQNKFSNVSLGDVLAAGAGASLIAFFATMSKLAIEASNLLKGVGGLVGAFKGIAEGINGVFESISEIAKSKATAIKMEAITGLIKSVVMLAGAVAVLAMMDPERVKNSAIVIGVLAASLVGLGAAFSAISTFIRGDSIIKSSGSLLAISGSLLMLAIALKKLGEIDTKNILPGLIAMGVLLLELSVALGIMSRLTPKLSAGSVAIISISASLLLLTRAIAQLSGIRQSDLLPSLAVLTFLMGFLAILGNLSGKASLGSAAGIIGTALAIKLIISALEDLANMNSSNLQSGLKSLSEIMGLIAALFIAMKFAGKHASGAGAAVALMSVSILILVQAIKQLGDIDQASIDKATKSITQMLALFAVITAMTNFAGANAAKAGVGITLMSGSILIIAGAMMLLSKIDEDGLKRATNAVTQIMAMFAILVAAMGLMRSAEKTLIILGVIVGSLAAAIAILSLIDPGNITAASTAISMVIASMALLVAATGVMKKANGTLIIMTLVVAGLAGILAGLSQLPIQSSMSAATSLSALLIAISASALILQHVNPAAAAYGIAGFAIVIAGVGALLVALGALVTYIPQAQEFLEAGIPVLGAIGEGIGEFIGRLAGALAGGVLEEFSESIVVFGSNLSKFMEEVQGFLDGAKTIDDSAMSGINALVGMILALTAADFLDGINFFGEKGGAIKNLTENLPALGDAMTEFASKFKGNEVDKINIAAQAGKALAEMMNSLPRSGGVFGFFTGEVDIEGLSKTLPMFATALVEYGKNLSGLDSQSIMNSVEPAKALVEISNSINGEGGLLQALGGSNTLALRGLSNNLPKLGEALKGYSDSLKGTDFDLITQSVTPTKALIEISNLINGEGGLLQLLGGSNDVGMKGFIENIVNLGNALKAFAVSVEGMPTSGLQPAIDTAKALVEISNSLDSEAGIANLFGGSQTVAMRGLINNITPLANALKAFAVSVEGMPTSGLQPAIETTRALVEISNSLDSEAGIVNLFVGSKYIAMKGLISNVVSLGNALKRFGQSVSGFDGSGATTAISVAKAIAEISGALDSEAGIVNFFGGSKDVAMKGLIANIGSLGRALQSFGESVSNLNESKVNAAVEVARGVAKIVNSLDNEAGFLSIFGGSKTAALVGLTNNLPALGTALGAFSNNLGDFDSKNALRAVSFLSHTSSTLSNLDDFSKAKTIGENLKILGEKFASFSSSISNLNFDGISQSVYWLGRIKDVISDFPQIDTSGLENFINMLSVAGTNAIEAFSNALVNGSNSATTAINTVCTNVLSTAQKTLISGASRFVTIGKLLMTSLAAGIRSGASGVISAIRNVLSQVVAEITKYDVEFEKAGQRLMKALQLGLSSLKDSVVNDAHTVGYNISLGMARGILDGESSVINAATKVAKEAIKSAQKTLDEHSPSKVFIQIGKYVCEGFAIGLEKSSNIPANKSEEMAKNVIDTVANAISALEEEMNNADYSPTITPVIDGSKFRKGLSDIDKDLNNSRTSLSLSSTIDDLNATIRAIDGMRASKISDNQNRSLTQITNNYDMTQNNYSPKALNRSDIYRRTNNQFSRLKDMVKNK